MKSLKLVQMNVIFVLDQQIQMRNGINIVNFNTFKSVCGGVLFSRTANINILSSMTRTVSLRFSLLRSLVGWLFWF